MEISSYSTDTEQSYRFPPESYSQAIQSDNYLALQTNSSKEWLAGNFIYLPPTVLQSKHIQI